jgi:DNA repair protein RecO (recombination protein O)
MENALTLAGLSSLCTLARLLPERDPHPSLYEVTLFVLGYLDDPDVWPALMVRWELALLDELGFGLDLAACAATGDNDNLIYVSPKSGRAVSASAGEPYKERLLRLPAFLSKGRQGAATPEDVVRLGTHTGVALAPVLGRGVKRHTGLHSAGEQGGAPQTVL